MASKTSLRQIVHRSKLDQLTTDDLYQAAPAGGKPAGSTEADNLLTSLNSEVTSPLRMRPTDPTADLIVHIDAITVTNPETGKHRIAQSINGVLPAFTGATITLPSTANGTSDIVNSDGENIVNFTQSASKFSKCAVFLLNNGDLSMLVGDEASSVALAPYPGMIKNSISIGYFIIETDASQNVQAVDFSDVYQMEGGGGGGSADGGGAGGGEIVDLLFRARLEDSFGDRPDGTTPVDISAGKTDATLFDTTNEYFRFAYDADKTVTTVGTACTISASPAFTIKAGDVVVSGGEVRKIASISSQTSVTLEAAFSVDLTTAASCISQCIHTVDLNDFDNNGDGLAVNDQISDDVSELLVGYWDSSASGDTVPDFGTIAHVGFSVSGDGSSWSDTKTRQTGLDTTEQAISVPTADANLYIRFFANKSSGNGSVNLLKFKAFWMPEVAELAGSDFLVAFARPTSSIYQNVTHSVVGGNSRFTFDYAFGRGLEPGNPSGSALEVIINGQQVPRWIDGTKVDLTGAYFKEISDTSIELDQDYSAADVDFMFRVKNLVIDTRTQNTSNIAGIKDYLNEGFQDFVLQPKIDVPFTEIVNRAQISDLSSDLLPRMGIQRLQFKNIEKIVDEVGPSGEPVYKVSEDTFDQIRFVGVWRKNDDTGGTYIQPDIDNSDYFLEVSFYGTGLNALARGSSSFTRDFTVYLDGVLQGTVTTQGSGLLSNREYESNEIYNLVSGKTLSWHTVKIVSASYAFMLYGLEILNETASLQVPTGDAFVNRKKVTHSALESVSYNSGFETGVLGTAGGRVLTYLKSDGTIGKAVTPTDSSAAIVSGVDHSNEEIVRKINWREFGVGRSDDFSTLSTSTSDRAFTLDDGTTTLVGDDVRVSNGYFSPALNKWFVLTFVGTGLDLIRKDGGDTTTDHSYSVSVDGASPVTKTYDPSASIRTEEICSGLPYGTHTVKIVITSLTVQNPYFLDFIIYQPKTPELPGDAVKLSSYNLMANYVANTDVLSLSQGVLRKQNTREFIYEGSMQIGAAPNTAAFTESGFLVNTTTNGDKITAYFYGTGFAYRSLMTTAGGTTQLTLDDSITDFSSYTTSTYGSGVGFTASTGILDDQASTTVFGAGLEVSGIALGWHKIEFTRLSGTTTYFGCLDIITPIHSYETVSQANSEIVGSQGIHDERALTPVKPEAFDSEAFNASRINKTTLKQYDLTVRGTNWTTVRAVGIPYQTIDGTWRLRFNIEGTISSGAASLDIYLNGVVFKNGLSAAYGQPVTVHTDNKNGTRGYAINNASNVNMLSATTDTVWTCSGDVELEQKPDFVIE